MWRLALTTKLYGAVEVGVSLTYHQAPKFL